MLDTNMSEYSISKLSNIKKSINNSIPMTPSHVKCLHPGHRQYCKNPEPPNHKAIKSRNYATRSSDANNRVNSQLSLKSKPTIKKINGLIKAIDKNNGKFT